MLKKIKTFGNMNAYLHVTKLILIKYFYGKKLYKYQEQFLKEYLRDENE